MSRWSELDAREGLFFLPRGGRIGSTNTLGIVLEWENHREKKLAFDPGLAERIREILRGRAAITEKKMFGGIAFMSRDYMFIGISGPALMVRVGPVHYPAALQTAHVREMDFTGRPMKGYVFVDPPGFEDDADLAKWLDVSLGFIASLPPKKSPK